MTERPASRGGFTLIEAMLVLLVIALAGLIVAPELRPLLERTQRQSSARGAASFLDDVRRRAVLAGEVLTVSLDEGERQLVYRQGAEEPVLGAYPLGEGEVQVTLEPAAVRYFPQGHSSGGVLLFRRGEAELYRVEIGSFTGLARLRDGTEG